MSLSIGIVGLPNVGKSTLFKALTNQNIEIANYPFATIDPNVGVVIVPDERLERLALMSHSKKIVPTAIEFYDIAGLVKGANLGEGLGNKFLSHIRETNAIVEVVRVFEDANIIHVEGRPEPKRDIQIIELELILADLSSAEKALQNLEKNIRAGNKESIATGKVLEKIIKNLKSNLPIRTMVFTNEEKFLIKSFSFLTQKPLMLLLNVDEKNLSDSEKLSQIKKKLAEEVNIDPQFVVASDLKFEAECAELSPDEAEEIRSSLSKIKSEGGLQNLIKTGYELLNLITFITTGEDETRAWTITNGSLAPQAAGRIHTDFEKGFIRADVINWQKLLEAGSWGEARSRGWLKSEGKEYVVKDGDVIEFKFAN
jgi:GTP-binding protein YchF